MILVGRSCRGFRLQPGALMVALLLQQSAQLRMHLERGRIGRLIRRIEIELEQPDGKLRLLVIAAEKGSGVYQSGPVRFRTFRIGTKERRRVMIRPLQAVNLVHQQMASTLERMKPRE